MDYGSAQKKRIENKIKIRQPQSGACFPKFLELLTLDYCAPSKCLKCRSCRRRSRSNIILAISNKFDISLLVWIVNMLLKCSLLIICILLQNRGHDNAINYMAFKNRQSVSIHCGWSNKKKNMICNFDNQKVFLYFLLTAKVL